MACGASTSGPARANEGPAVRMQTLLASLAALCILSQGNMAHAQVPAAATSASGIYTCVDSSGRTLTADRPIAECFDREQRELNPSGTLKRKVDPNYTEQELADREAKARQAALQAALQSEAAQRKRALLLRYPNAAAHESAREQVLLQIDSATEAARNRLAVLSAERARIEDELRLHKGEPPPSAQRQLADSDLNIAEQKHFIADGEEQKKRINARFDDESAQLESAWSYGEMRKPN